MSSYNIPAIQQALSTARLSTYAAQAPEAKFGPYGALALYAWHAQISSAFLTPLHICEVVVRNAISEALEKVYGPRWPWNRHFQITLPQRLESELVAVAQAQPTTGKVIPELTFFFWETILTRRYDHDLWGRYIHSTFPNFDPQRKAHVATIRNALYSNINQLRDFRNRIAHHEPIFGQDLAKRLTKIESIVSSRCAHTSQWMMAHQTVSALLAQRP